MKRYSTIALAVVLIAAGCKDNPITNPIDAPTVDCLLYTSDAADE